MTEAKGVLASRGWETLFFFSEAIMIIFYCVGTEFAGGLNANTDQTTLDTLDSNVTATVGVYYAMWMDVHVMIFIGFGFLMVFLKTHCWASVGFNFLVGAWAMQCGMLFIGFWHNALTAGFAHKVQFDLKLMV
jgi:hypothetical protein